MNIRLGLNVFVFYVVLLSYNSGVFAVDMPVAKGSAAYSSTSSEFDQSLCLEGLGEYILWCKAKCHKGADRGFVANISSLPDLSEHSLDLAKKIASMLRPDDVKEITLNAMYRVHDALGGNKENGDMYSQENGSVFPEWQESESEAFDCFTQPNE